MAGRFSPRICFISYRSDRYTEAKDLQVQLAPAVQECILVPPASLCLPTEVRTPFGYFELIAALEPHIARADAFLALDTPGYHDDSPWTGIEVRLWRMNHTRIARCFVNDAGRAQYDRLVKVDRVWWFERSMLRDCLRLVRDPRFEHLASPFSKRCLIVPCERCDRHSLVTTRYAKRHGTAGIACPGCATRAVIRYADGRFTVPYTAGASRPMDLHTLITLSAYPAHDVVRSADGSEHVSITFNGEQLALLRMPGERFD